MRLIAANDNQPDGSPAVILYALASVLVAIALSEFILFHMCASCWKILQ